MYTEKPYVTEVRAKLDEFRALLDREFDKQGRRTNRESERRSRKLLGSFNSRIYRPYKKASLEDLKSSSETQPEGV